jgi:hypothetical protein
MTFHMTFNEPLECALARLRVLHVLESSYPRVTYMPTTQVSTISTFKITTYNLTHSTRWSTSKLLTIPPYKLPYHFLTNTKQHPLKIIHT